MQSVVLTFINIWKLKWEQVVSECKYEQIAIYILFVQSWHILLYYSTKTHHSSQLACYCITWLLQPDTLFLWHCNALLTRQIFTPLNNRNRGTCWYCNHRYVLHEHFLSGNNLLNNCEFTATVSAEESPSISCLRIVATRDGRGMSERRATSVLDPWLGRQLAGHRPSGRRSVCCGSATGGGPGSERCEGSWMWEGGRGRGLAGVVECRREAVPAGMRSATWPRSGICRQMYTTSIFSNTIYLTSSRFTYSCTSTTVSGSRHRPPMQMFPSHFYKTEEKRPQQFLFNSMYKKMCIIISISILLYVWW